jgi:hypothetical protein
MGLPRKMRMKVSPNSHTWHNESRLVPTERKCDVAFKQNRGLMLKTTQIRFKLAESLGRGCGGRARCAVPHLYELVHEVKPLERA